MLSFKQFVKDNHHKKGFDVNLWLSPDGKVHFVNIFKESKELEEGKVDPNEPDITDGEGYKHFGEFKPTNLDDKKLTAEEFHRHLAKHGLYASAARDVMHKDPHMQDFEDGVHEILGGSKHEDWHQDYGGASAAKGGYVPKHAAVYSSSGSATKLGKKEGKETKEISGATSPGKVSVFNDTTVYHRAPTKEERGDRHFIRASGIREIPKEGIPKKGGGYWNPTNEEDMQQYRKSKDSGYLRGMHRGLYNKIHNHMVMHHAAKEGSAEHETTKKLIALMNHPDYKDRFNKNDWHGKTDWSTKKLTRRKSVKKAKLNITKAV